MFENLLTNDIRILRFDMLENGNYLITIKQEYINPELNVASFEIVPAVSEFDRLINQNAIAV